MSAKRAARRRAAKLQPKPKAITAKPDDWAALRREGLRMAEEHQRPGRHVTHHGRPVTVKILAQREVRAGDEVQLSTVKIELDWKMAIKFKILEAANDIMTRSYMLGSLDPALHRILVSVIEEKGLYEDNIGEFFLLYGRFEQKYRVFEGKETREKMMELMQGGEKFLKPYKDQRSGKEYANNPLPYSVRNILAHANSPNPLDQDGEELGTFINTVGDEEPRTSINTVDGEELRTSIKLLKSWLER